MKLIKFIFAIALSWSIHTIQAQIQVSPYVAEGMVDGLDQNAAGILEDRLRSILSQNNIIARFGDSRFVLAAKITVTGKEALATAPVKIVSRLQLHLGIRDGMDGTCFGSTSMEVTGVGATDQQAVTNAIRKINGRLEGVNDMIQTATQRIVDYYERNASKIIATANTQMNAGKYDEAIFMLAQIPQECSLYNKAQTTLLSAYRKQINHNSATLLNQAQATWAANPTSENAANIVATLSEIDPSAACYPQAKALMAKVEAQGKLEQTREYNLRVKEINNQTALEKARIKAVQNIAVAYCKSRPKVVYRTTYINRWWY